MTTYTIITTPEATAKAVNHYTKECVVVHLSQVVLNPGGYTQIATTIILDD